ncbi:MAG: hypothetical protein OXG26_01600, partial [Caldilineaceae bacterium]|nr:hypothetical protein [Caldilineaceae bacterium]
EGRHKACPYRNFEGMGGGGRAGTRPAPTGTLRGWAAGEGRHKACPYRNFEGMGGGGGQAQGLPLPGV